jgi:hypothetical protein
MNRKKQLSTILFSFLFLLLSIHLAGQQKALDFTDYYAKSKKSTKAGMYGLGIWAVGNIAIGSYGWATQSGEQKYFHQMNALWNTVNLSLSTVGLYNLRNFPNNESDLLAYQKRMERIFLINAGLDVLYMGSGVLLQRMNPESDMRREQFSGYGKALVLQGAFLFGFDLLMFGIIRTQRNEFQKQIRITPNNTLSGISITYTW